MKSIKKEVITLAGILLIQAACFCQTDKADEITADIAEELAADDSDPGSAEIYIEYLNELTENPIRINSGSEAELARFFFLSDFQIKSLADYIKKTGKIVSVNEIPGISGFDQHAAEMMIPFLTLKEYAGSFQDSISVRNTLISNFIFKPGESDSSSIGSLTKILSKYRMSAGRFSAGFSAEKDAGERLFMGSPSLPDFLSAYSSYSGKGIFRKIIIGDFSLKFGLGTSINTTIRTGISLTAYGPASGRNNLKPYTSTDENSFFRGTAAELSLKNTDLIIFFSRNRIDATLESSADSSASYVNNLYKTGLHNTSSLLLKKDNLTELSYGISLTYNIKSIMVGINCYETRFSIPTRRDINNPGGIYDFEGTKNRVSSVNYNWLTGRILMYGEFSVNKTDFALVQGASLRPSDRLSINMFYRNYTPGFVTFNGKGPGYSSSAFNEKGIMGNFTFEAARNLFISAGCDISHSPWLKYRCSFPSSSQKQEIIVRFLPSEKFSFYFTYSYRHSMINKQVNGGIPGIEEQESRTFKWILKYATGENMTFSTRIDFKTASPSGSSGMLLLQDMVYRFKALPVTLWFRYCIFSTDDWYSRLYTYENDLLYNFSIPALSGDGSRGYLMAEWKICHFAEMRIKYGLTSIFTGSNNFSENDDIRLQFRLWF